MGKGYATGYGNASTMTRQRPRTQQGRCQQTMDIESLAADRGSRIAGHVHWPEAWWSVGPRRGRHPAIAGPSATSAGNHRRGATCPRRKVVHLPSLSMVEESESDPRQEDHGGQ